MADTPKCSRTLPHQVLRLLLAAMTLELRCTRSAFPDQHHHRRALLLQLAVAAALAPCGALQQHGAWLLRCQRQLQVRPVSRSVFPVFRQVQAPSRCLAAAALGCRYRQPAASHSLFPVVQQLVWVQALQVHLVQAAAGWLISQRLTLGMRSMASQRRSSAQLPVQAQGQQRGLETG